MKFGQHPLDQLPVSAFRGSQIVIRFNFENLPELQKLCTNAIHKLLGTLAAFSGTLLHFLSMLIQTAQEADRNTLATLESGQGVR